MREDDVEALLPGQHATMLTGLEALKSDLAWGQGLISDLEQCSEVPVLLKLAARYRGRSESVRLLVTQMSNVDTVAAIKIKSLASALKGMAIDDIRKAANADEVSACNRGL